MDLFIKILIVIVFWGLVSALANYFKKRGSKLGEEKPIYKKVLYGIYIILGIGALALIILTILNE